MCTSVEYCLILSEILAVLMYRSSMGAGLNGSGGQQGGGGGNPESELQLASSLNELGGVLQVRAANSLIQIMNVTHAD
jgi:hypothetical protein